MDQSQTRPFLTALRSASRDVLEQTLLLTILVLRLYSVPLVSLFQALARTSRPTGSTVALSRSPTSSQSGTNLCLRLSSKVSELWSAARTRAYHVYRTISILYKLGDFLQDEGPSEILGTLGQPDIDPVRRETISFVSPTRGLGAHTGPTASQIYHAALQDNEQLGEIFSELGEDDSSSETSRLVHHSKAVGHHIGLPASRRGSDTSIQVTPERLRSPFNQLLGSPASNETKHSPTVSPIPTYPETLQIDNSLAQRRISHDRMRDQRAPLPKIITSSPEYPTWTKVFDVCEHPKAPDNLRRCQTCVRRQKLAKSKLPRRSLDAMSEWRTSNNNDTQLSLPANLKSSPNKLRRRSRKAMA